MSRSILEGMARAAFDNGMSCDYGSAFDKLSFTGDKEKVIEDVRAAMRWLAENVHSDEFASALDAAASVKRGMQVNHTATDERVHFANKLRAALLEAAKDE